MFPVSLRFRAKASPRGLISCAGLCVAISTGIAAAPAQAALIATGTCNGAALSQPFQQWGDPNSYELLPGGDFESSTAGWTLTGGARTVAGSEPYGVTGARGATALTLPQGASAQSPLTCVNAGYPALRFFARNAGLASTVLVQLVYKHPILGLIPIPVGVVALTGNWQPTLRMLTASVVGGALSGGTAQLAIRFTALTGSSTIDDVFVDPRMKA